MIRRVVLLGLFIFLAVVIFMAGLYMFEESRCAFLEREFPDYYFRVNLLKCQTIINGKWIDADAFVVIGKSP
jgi:hypothetical protein